MAENEVLDNAHGAHRDSNPRWYIVHTYSGHENKVKMNIEKMVENRGMQDRILEVTIPMEDVIEIKNGERKLKTRKKFPSYVFVKMIASSDEAWYLVRNTQGVTGFLGHGSDPLPLSEKEEIEMGLERCNVELDIKVGDVVRVMSGAFESFTAIVDDVNLDKETLKIRVDMLGRETPVELKFDQVSKIV